MSSCPEEMDWEFGRFWKRFSWGPTMALRSWSPTMQLCIWDWTLRADNWVSAIGAENGVLCHWFEFFTVAAAVKFIRSQPAKMNWDLKHYEMCRTLGGVVSIVWLRKTFKNCVSPRVEKLKSEANNCVCTWTTVSTWFRLCFVFRCICICICTVGLIPLWSWVYKTKSYLTAKIK